MRVNIRQILRDPETRKELLIRAVYTIQLREDPTMTMERARAAFEVATKEDPVRVLWNHDLQAPQFWKVCSCGERLGPFPTLAAAQAAVSCQSCLDELRAKLRRAKCQTSE